VRFTATRSQSQNVARTSPCIGAELMILPSTTNASPAASTFGSDSEQRINHAASAFQELTHTPDKGIPRDLLERANCIIIIPGMKKGAFGFGGKYGRGFASCRGRDGGAPASVRIEAASFGLQIGASSTDVFMLVMNANGMKRLTADKFTLGGEAGCCWPSRSRD
jgi:SH3 domain-containing YSC84-like protein 1